MQFASVPVFSDKRLRNVTCCLLTSDDVQVGVKLSDGYLARGKSNKQEWRKSECTTRHNKEDGEKGDEEECLFTDAVIDQSA